MRDNDTPPGGSFDDARRRLEWAARAAERTPDPEAAARQRELLARLDAVGYRIGQGDNAAAYELPAPILHVLTGGALGAPPDAAAAAAADAEAEAEGSGSVAGSLFMASHVVRVGITRAAAERYLADAGIPARAALEAVRWDPAHTDGGGGAVVNYDRLTADERTALTTAGRTLRACGVLVYEHLKSPPADGRVTVDGEPVQLAPEDVAGVAGLWTVEVDADGRVGKRLDGARGPDLGPHTRLPSAAAALPVYRALMARATLTPEEAAAAGEAWRARALTRPDGTRAPSPRAWLAAHPDMPVSAESLVARLEQLARKEAERDAAAAREEAKRDRERAEAAEAALEEARARKRRPPALRQGIGFLRAIAQRATHVDEALKRGQLGKLGARLTTAEAEARKLFKYEPLGWKERLVVHALAAIAREQGKLEAHPWALRRKPLAADDAPRVRIAFPGVAELARVAGYQPDASGRIPKEVRRVLENALRDLTTRPRWVAEPVLVPVQKGRRTELVEDVRVVQTLWVELAATALTRHAELRLHPVAFASHLASYVPVGDLAARYEAARRAVGGRRMLDEWATADDYLRYRASVKLGDARAGAVRAAKGDGATPDEAAAHGAAAVAAVGDSIRADVSDATLRDALGIAHLTRDRGAAPARKRVADALAFAQAMGTLRTFTLEDGTKGPTWRLELAPPAVHGAGEDAAQGQLFAPAAPAGGTP
jgi:hypothetical protein